MIRINLAARKQGAVSGGSVREIKGPTLLTSPMDALGGLRELPIKKVVLLLLVIIVGNYVLGDYKDGEIKKLDAELATMRQEQTKLNADLAKTKGYEDIKKVLDADELTLRTKIETIQTLLNGR